MKLVAYVIDRLGAAWDGLTVEVVAPGAPLSTIGKGKVTAGRLEAFAEKTTIFGLRVEGTGVLTAPVRVEGDTVDLGTLVWAKEPLVAMELFCADGGKVHGLPKALAAALAAAPAGPAPAEPAPDASVDTSLGAVLSRTGEELAAAQRTLAATGGFLLGTVQLTLRASERADGLKVGGLAGGEREVQVTLVPTPETRVASGTLSPTRLAAAGTTSFEALPPDKTADAPTLPVEGGTKTPTGGTTTTVGTATGGATTTGGTTTGGATTGGATTGGATTGGATTGGSDALRIPDLLGYSRALAERKLAALGLVADVSRIVTAGPVGVVARQSPAPGAAATPGAAVRLYVNLGRS